MNKKQKGILTVSGLAFLVLFVVIVVSLYPYTFVPTNGGNGGELPIAPELEEISPSVSTDGTVDLDWNDVSDAVCYAVYRSKDDGSFTVLTYFASESYYNDLISISGTYTYKITAGNVDGGYSGYSNTRSVIVSILPPAPELNPISPTTDTDGSIDLQWSSVSGATEYKLKMSRDGGTTWETVIITEATTFTKSGLTNGIYKFKVKAYNEVGGSVDSNVRSVTVSIPELPPEVPDAPVISITTNDPNTDGEINLEWDSVSGATMYTIFRWKDGTNPEILKQDFSENNYGDSVSSNGVYLYKVKAGNSDKEYSEYSNEVSITVQIPSVPDVPVMNELEYEIINYTIKVYIDWEAVDCDSYVLYRSFNDEVYKPVEGGVHSTTGYTEILTEDGTYVYKVSAVNIHGESEMSNSVTVVVEGGGVAPDYTMLYILLGVLGILTVPIAIILVKRRKK